MSKLWAFSTVKDTYPVSLLLFAVLLIFIFYRGVKFVIAVLGTSVVYVRRIGSIRDTAS